MSETAEIARELAAAVRDFRAGADAYRIASKPELSGNNHATVSINAGGLGVWIATTGCIVMLAVNVVLVMIFIDQGRRIDDLNDKLTATYMMAPHLKPPEKK